MATIPRTAPGDAPGVIYPESDGKPLGETGLHVRAILALFDLLGLHLADDPMVAVHANMFLYRIEGRPKACVAPDVFVARGVPAKPDRRTFKTWEEGKGPDLIVEVSSRSTHDEDRKRKFTLYQDVLRVPEYFLFNPEDETPNPTLMGFRLVGPDYQPIAPVDGRLPSEVLGLHLERDGIFLRLYDPVAARRIPNRAEIADAAVAHAERARRIAEEDRRIAAEERRRADEEHRNAEAERRRADEERLHAEQALRAKDDELDRLRRELEALRRSSPGGA